MTRPAKVNKSISVPGLDMFPSFGHLTLPPSAAALDRWFLSLRPETRMEILFDRIEFLMAIRRKRVRR